VEAVLAADVVADPAVVAEAAAVVALLLLPLSSPQAATANTATDASATAA